MTESWYLPSLTFLGFAARGLCLSSRLSPATTLFSKSAVLQNYKVRAKLTVKTVEPGPINCGIL